MKVAGNQAPAVDAPDMTLVLLALALLLVGLVAISSASIEYAEWHFQNPWYHSQRHLIYLLAGIIAAVASYRVTDGVLAVYRMVVVVWRAGAADTGADSGCRP